MSQLRQDANRAAGSRPLVECGANLPPTNQRNASARGRESHTVRADRSRHDEPDTSRPCPWPGTDHRLQQMEPRDGWGDPSQSACAAWTHRRVHLQISGSGCCGIGTCRDSRPDVLYKQRGEAEYAIGFGVSQSAMVLRALVYEGFNADESGKKVFDGIFSHVAGGRRTTLGRFAQPSRTAGPLRNASLSRTDEFPFSDVEQTDPYTKRRDGVLKCAVAANVVPFIFSTNSTYEYGIWRLTDSHHPRRNPRYRVAAHHSAVRLCRWSAWSHHSLPSTAAADSFGRTSTTIDGLCGHCSRASNHGLRPALCPNTRCIQLCATKRSHASRVTVFRPSQE